MGIVQGLTEFLPISSSAHLRLTPVVMGFSDPGVGFTAVIQLGTVLAVLIYFAKDLGKALMGWVKSFTPEGKNTDEAKIGWAVFWASIPVVVIGLLLKDKLEGVRSLWVTAACFFVMGLVMWVAEKFGKKNREATSVTLTDSLTVGLFQCLALVPGMSRSGSTLTGAFLRGFDRDSAVRLSFLMSVPSVAGAGFFEFWHARKEINAVGSMPTLVATIVSFVVGYACIAWLLNYIKKSGVTVFMIYRVVLAAVLAGLMLTGHLDPNAGSEEKAKPSATASQ